MSQQALSSNVLSSEKFSLGENNNDDNDNKGY